MFRDPWTGKLEWLYIGLCAGALALVAIVTGLVVHDCRAQDACRNSGGVVVTSESDCEDVFVCHEINKVPICQTQRVCGWHCERISR